MARYVRPLAELDVADALWVGGKAAVLGRLVKLGFHVPDGFAVTAAAFDAWVAHHDLQTMLERELDSSRLETRLRDSPLPDEVAAQVRDAFAVLGADAVAVRSSAIGEDAPDASFAGILETYLEVSTAAAALDRVRDVFMSGFHPRALAYTRRIRGAARPLRVACLVQRMVEPVASGVLFTAHPVSGSRERLALGAVSGLGEGLVSGQRSGDYLEVERKDLSVTWRHTAADQPVIAAELARELAQLGLSLEEQLGAPQDIEWAQDGERLFLLQARPITTTGPPSRPQQDLALRDELDRLARLDPKLVFTNLFAAELLPAPTRATLELLRAMAQPDAGVMTAYHQDVGLRRFEHALDMSTICGRLYFELGSLARIVRGVGLPIEPRYVQQPLRPDEHLDLDRGWLRIKVLHALGLLPLYGWRVARLAWRCRRLAKGFSDRYRRELLPRIEEQVRSDRAIALQKLDDDALAEYMDGLFAWLSGEGRRIWELGNLAALVSLGIVSELCRRFFGDQHGAVAASLTRGAPGNETLEMNQALVDLAQAPSEAGLARFVERFGHRASTELELAEPRWREDPSFIEETLRRLSDGARSESAPADFQQALHAALSRCGHPFNPLTWLRRALLRRATETARRNAWLRETPKFHYLRRFEQLRATVLETGRRLHERHQLDSADDVFHLERAEARSTDPHTAKTARQRRELRRLLLPLPLPPTIQIADIKGLGDRLYEPAAQAELAGLGVSGGRFVGTACVVHHLGEAIDLPDDAVLVAPRTDPTWTPLFLSVRAIVVEVGSPISHSAIVAREYGLPAVVNVTAATARITNGQRLLVDGDAGVVSLLVTNDRQ